MHQAQRETITHFQDTAMDNIFAAENADLADAERQIDAILASTNAQLAQVEVGVAIETQLVRIADALARIAASR